MTTLENNQTIKLVSGSLTSITKTMRRKVRTLGATQEAAKLKLVHNIQVVYACQDEGSLPEVLTSTSLLLSQVDGGSIRDYLCLSGNKEALRLGKVAPRVCDLAKASGSEFGVYTRPDTELARTYSIAHAELQEARGILRQLGLMGLVQGGDERVCGNLEKNHYKSRGQLVAVNTWNEDSIFNDLLERNSFMPLTDKEFCVAMGLGW